MSVEQRAKDLQDTILGYLNITREELEAAIAGEEAVQQPVAEEPDVDDGWAWDDEEASEGADEEKQTRMEVLGDVIDNTLLQLQVGVIQLESANELVDTIKAVEYYEGLLKRYA